MSNDKERKFYDKIIKMREQYKQSNDLPKEQSKLIPKDINFESSFGKPIHSNDLPKEQSKLIPKDINFESSFGKPIQSKPIQSNSQNDTMYSDEYIKAIRFFIRIKNGFAELHKNKKS
jgi:hypothetical protein